MLAWASIASLYTVGGVLFLHGLLRKIDDEDILDLRDALVRFRMDGRGAAAVSMTGFYLVFWLPIFIFTLFERK